MLYVLSCALFVEGECSYAVAADCGLNWQLKYESQEEELYAQCQSRRMSKEDRSSGNFLVSCSRLSRSRTS